MDCAQKTCMPRIACTELRFALGEDAAVVPTLEMVLTRGLIFRTLIPSFGLIVGRKLEDNDLLDRRPFQDFMAPMNGANSSRVLLKTGGNPQFVLIHLSCVASPFARKHNVSGQLFSLSASIR
jgi:hypothetical protein